MPHLVVGIDSWCSSWGTALQFRHRPNRFRGRVRHCRPRPEHRQRKRRSCWLRRACMDVAVAPQACASAGRRVSGAVPGHARRQSRCRDVDQANAVRRVLLASATGACCSRGPRSTCYERRRPVGGDSDGLFLSLPDWRRRAWELRQTLRLPHGHGESTT